MFNLFLTPVYDTESARQFRASMNKEFGIDQEYSGRADRLLAHLETFVNSFSRPRFGLYGGGGGHSNLPGPGRVPSV